MLKPAALLLALVLVPSPQDSQGRRAAESSDEFPPQDDQIASLVFNGLNTRHLKRLMTEAPDSLETVRALAEAGRRDEVLAVLRTIVDKQPRRIADAFEATGRAVYDFPGDDELMRGRLATFRGIVADAVKRLPELPREEAARAARVFLYLPYPDGDVEAARREQKSRIERFIDEYRGTEAALLVEVDEIGTPDSTGTDYAAAMRRGLDALESFARAHRGTTAAAYAIYLQGAEWSSPNTLGLLEPRGADPSDRFMRVWAIVQELESGRYPPCEWVRKAPELLVNFFMPDDAPISPSNLDRMIAAYQDFVRTHLATDGPYPDREALDYLITWQIANLVARKGQRTAGMEHFMSELERTVPNPSAVRYLRALFYMKPFDEASAPASDAKARAELSALSTAGAGAYNRRALATLAAIDFEEQKCAAARVNFQKYVASYPKSSWAWVATLRAGQCAEALGDPKAAVADYLRAAAAYAHIPPAFVLGHEYAARAYESAGDFERAVAEHQHALDGWDNDFGPTYSTFAKRSTRPTSGFVPSTDAGEVKKDALAPRIAQLQRSLGAACGVLLERGRTRLAQNRFDEAAAELRRLLEQFPSCPVASQARSLLHRARLERTLVLAAVERPEMDEAAAMKELDALAREPTDFPVTAARIARASLLWKRGDADGAEEAMSSALNDWQSRQQISKFETTLEQDVAAIRAAVFLPHGGPIYGGGQWNAFSWPEQPAPFLLANADVVVKRHDGAATRVALVQAFPVNEKVIVFDTEQIAFLTRTIVSLGGTRRREPRQIMETPNQPVGDSMQIIRLWNKFFATRAGHWGGWELETYPVVTEIQFTNAECTKAAAKVTIGYSGATVELEKKDGKWIAKRLTNQWVT